MRRKNNFNFILVWENKLKKEVSGGKFQFKAKDLVTLVSVAIGILLIASLPWIWDYKLGFNLANTKQLIVGLKEIDKQVQTLNALKSQVQNLNNVIDLTRKSTHDPGPILEKLRLLLPMGTTIKSFSLQSDNSVTLAVSTPTPVDVARLWTSLLNSNLFQSVDIQTVSLIDKSQDFNLTLKLK